MSIFYLSALGCDTNDGLSPEAPLKTLARVQELMVGGDTVKLRCGDTFYGRMATPAGPDRDHPTTFESYGEGEKPVISQYKMAKPGAWEKHEDGVYKLTLVKDEKVPEYIYGNVTEPNANIGFMKVSGEIKYRKKFRYEDLAEQWDFYCDEESIFVKLDKCPCEYSDDIKLAPNVRMMAFANNMKVKGIVFRGSGAHGISGVVKGAYVSDCEFHELGGSRLGGLERNGKFNTTRYGNGVECWSNSYDVTVENCKFSEIYDVAITMQGNNVQMCWNNMHFRNNVIWKCVQAFEIWSSGDMPDTGFTNCYFENNVCIDSGFGWGYDARPNKHVTAHLLIYGLGCPLCDITVRNNILSTARENTIFKSGGIAAFPKGYKIYGNTIIRPAGQDIIRKESATDEEMAAFEKMIAENNNVYDMVTYP